MASLAVSDVESSGRRTQGPNLRTTSKGNAKDPKQKMAAIGSSQATLKSALTSPFSVSDMQPQ